MYADVHTVCWHHRTFLQAKALYDYAGEQADELTFAEDDMLCILEENSDGWMKGYIESAGEPGMFPGNYVEKA